MMQIHSGRMRRLIAADLLPERAGQPVKAVVHVSLAELRAMDGDSVLQEQWVTAAQAEWAAHRAGASAGGSDGAAWLTGAAAQAMTCDAWVIPVVTGNLNPAALDDLVRLCASLDRLDSLYRHQDPADHAILVAVIGAVGAIVAALIAGDGRDHGRAPAARLSLPLPRQARGSRGQVA
jgi:hypothetical protein